MTAKLKSETRASCESAAEQVAAIRRTLTRVEGGLDYAERNDRKVVLALVLSVDCEEGKMVGGNTIVALSGGPDALAHFVGSYLVEGVLRLQAEAEEEEDDAD